MEPTKDIDLLREYAARQSEAAFTELVSRRVNYVYSAALRQVRDPHLAGEITQAVFIILARKAGRIPENTVLTGWLFRTTRFVALAEMRNVAKRRRREQEATCNLNMDQRGPAGLGTDVAGARRGVGSARRKRPPGFAAAFF